MKLVHAHKGNPLHARLFQDLTMKCLHSINDFYLSHSYTMVLLQSTMVVLNHFFIQNVDSDTHS